MDDGPGLRELMRRVPSPVAVVTVEAGGRALGLTVETLVTLSLDPPLVGVAVSRQAALHELLREAGAFAASLLAEGQQPLAQHFARGVPPIALWEGIDVVGGRGDGPPLLAGALGWLEASLSGETPAGTHTLFVGEVARVVLGAGERGLVRARGAWLAA
ncbi:MAG TPA: flavin reductase family protein [Gaiellaceae bacterium]|nr:flavin reductase family protein [Gaiellaceae bacterium]